MIGKLENMYWTEALSQGSKLLIKNVSSREKAQ
jgi:hypothetical protein